MFLYRFRLYAPLISIILVLTFGLSGLSFAFEGSETDTLAPPLASKAPAEIVKNSDGTYSVITNQDTINLHNTGISRKLAKEWVYVDIGILIGRALKLNISKESLIPLIEQHIANRKGARDVVREGFRIQEIEEIAEGRGKNKIVKAFRLPVKPESKDRTASALTFSLGKSDDAITTIPMGDVTIYVSAKPSEIDAAVVSATPPQAPAVEAKATGNGNSLSSHFTDIVEHYRKLSDYVALSRASTSAPYRKQLVNKIKGILPVGCSILSVGAGQAHLEMDLVNEGFSVTGIDKSPDNVREADRRGFKIILGDIFESNFKDESVDCVLFSESIGHMDIWKVFAIANKLLKPEGKIIVTTYTEKSSGSEAITRYKIYSRGEIHQALAKNNFTSVNLELINARDSSSILLFTGEKSKGTFTPCSACKRTFDLTGVACNGMLTGSCDSCPAHKLGELMASSALSADSPVRQLTTRENYDVGKINASSSSHLEIIKNVVVPQDKPVAVIFDVHGTLLEPNWKKVYERIYTELMNTGPPSGWIKNHVLNRDDEEIIKTLRSISGKPDLQIRNRIEELRVEIWKNEDTPPIPGGIEFVKALKARGVPIIISSGSHREHIMQQLKMSGYLEYISEENVFGRDVEDKKSFDRSRVIGAIRARYPGHTVAYFDDADDTINVIKDEVICFGIPQGEGEEFEINRRRLIDAGAHFIINGRYDSETIDKLLTVPDEVQRMPLPAMIGRQDIAPALQTKEMQARSFLDTLKLVKAKKEAIPIIIALGTKWMKGYDKEIKGRTQSAGEGSDYQYKALNPLMSALNNFREEAGVKIIVRPDEELAEGIAELREGKPNAKVFVLADMWTIEKSDEFSSLRDEAKDLDAADYDDNTVFMAGVNSAELTFDSYMYVMEMLRLLLNMDLNNNLASDTDKIKIERKAKFYIFLPAAEKIEAQELETIYRMQIFA